MKVYKEKKKWSDHKPQYHLVEKFGWVKGGYLALVHGEIKTWCDTVYELKKGDEYEPYNKVFHRGNLCENCIKMVQLQVRSLKTRSDNESKDSKSNLGTKSS